MFSFLRLDQFKFLNAYVGKCRKHVHCRPQCFHLPMCISFFFNYFFCMGMYNLKNGNFRLWIIVCTPLSYAYVYLMVLFSCSFEWWGSTLKWTSLVSIFLSNHNFYYHTWLLIRCHWKNHLSNLHSVNICRCTCLYLCFNCWFGSVILFVDF
jgi:hypothetical protein